MFRNKMIAIAAILGALNAGSALARQNDGSAFVVYGQGGGFSALADLNDAGTADFDTGFNVGGGIAYEVSKHVAVRGNFTYARATARDAQSPAFEGAKFNRLFYGGDVQLRYPFAGGVAPYIFAGGGAATIDPSGSGTESFTKGAGKAGLGIGYALRGVPVSLFSEGTAWVYKWDRLGYDKTQFDVTWSGGVSYRFQI